MSQDSKLRICWHSVSPFIRSGYGKGTKEIVTRLTKYGYKVVISAYYGVEPGGILDYQGIPVVPAKEGSFGIQSAARIARDWGCNIGILFTDWWAFSDFPKLMPLATLYGPMDHVNYPEEILNFTKMYYKILSLCEFQKNYLQSVGIPSTVIPHGVDLNIFKPMDKKQVRRTLGIPDETFVFGTVAANCFDDQTEILTRRGWKRFDELSSTGDFATEFATLNDEGYLEYQTASDIIIQDYRGKMYRLHNKCIDFLVSPNHKMYVKRKIYSHGTRREFSKYERVQAREIFGKQRWYKKNAKWNGKEEQYFTLPAYNSRNHKEQKELSIPMDDWLEFFGYYISEGSSNGNRVSIKQYKASNPDKFFKIEDCLNRLPFRYSISKREQEFEINNTQLASFLTRFGRSDQKYIPLGLLQLSSRQLNILFEALMLGDGSKRMSNNVWTYSTSSMKLRDNIQEICLKIGYAGDYVLCKSHDQFSKISNKIIHINDYWNVTIKRKQVEPRNRQSWGHLSRDFEEEWVDYQGTIWCVTVPNHTVYVRRNGKVAWSSQSDKEDRKAHGRMMKAMRYFLDSNPDVKEKDITWIYHSNPVDPRGMPLSSICHKFKLDNVIRFMDPKIADVMITEEQLCALYNAMDVHVLCSKREGFGMPIIESQACGIPNICHDFSSMTELVKGHGWLCKSLGQDLNLETTPINAETAFPDVYSIADCIKDAYFDDKKREGFGLKSREFALRYNWDDLVHNSWVPLLEDIQEDLKNLPGRNIFGISNRKDEIFKSKFKEACK